MNNAERNQQLQAIYDEIEKSPPKEKVRKYFKEKPYQLRKGEGVTHDKQRRIAKCD